MGEFYDEIPDDPKLLEWVQKQVLFHVATAPLNGEFILVLGRSRYAVADAVSGKSIDRRACERIAQGVLQLPLDESESVLVSGLGWFRYVHYLWYQVLPSDVDFG